MKNLIIVTAIAIVAGAEARADAPLTPVINAITESQLWQDYSQPTFDYLQGLLPGADYIQGTQQFLDEWQRLHQDDARYEPNMDGAPQIPSSCLETGDEACQACFGPAYEKLNFVRYTLERLRAIYQSTKASTEHSISFGDSLAPSTGIAAIEWNRQKNDILAAMEHLKGTYREKYNGLMGTLRTALNDVAACEKQVFHEDNWYDRFGFIYYTYMQDRYLLTD
jgi:hypothetical protein